MRGELKDILDAHGKSVERLAELATDVAEQLSELTDLLKRADRLQFRAGTRWLYWQEARGEWVIREEWERGSGRIGSSPNLIKALKKLLEAK